MCISSQFLNEGVETWEDDSDFEAAKKIVHSLRVTNDIAERGVALMEESNKLMTIDEEQKQYLLLWIKEYRKKYPDFMIQKNNACILNINDFNIKRVSLSVA